MQELTPTYRGYDTFLGYYHMAEDYFTHKQDIKGDGVCSGTYTDFSNSSGTDINVLWGHGGTPGPNLPQLALTNCTIDENACRHAFRDQITNLTTNSARTCCNACAANPQCASWNWFHNDSHQDPSLCTLKSDVGAINQGHSNCDSGVLRNAGPKEDDYSASIFAREAQRLIAVHAQNHNDKPMFMYVATPMITPSLNFCR